jgi:hypothetical protein
MKINGGVAGRDNKDRKKGRKKCNEWRDIIFIAGKLIKLLWN